MRDDLPAIVAILVSIQYLLYGKTIHQGRKVNDLEKMPGIKQERLAFDLGAEWNQKKKSQLEGKEMIDDKLLEQIAGYLKVPVEAIKNFDEEAAISFIGNTFNDASSALQNFKCTFNPLDKFVEAMEANKHLYETLLESEEEKVVMLQKMLEEKK